MTSNSLSKPSLKDQLGKYRLFLLHPGLFFDELSEQFAQQEEPPTIKQSLPLLIMPAIVCGLGIWLISDNPTGGLVRGIGGIVGLVVWALIEKYAIKIFDSFKRFRTILYLVAWSGQFMMLAWIPFVGEPMFMIISGFWCYKAFKHALKMQDGAALSAVCVPAVTMCMLGMVVIFAGFWIASLSTIFIKRD